MKNIFLCIASLVMSLLLLTACTGETEPVDPTLAEQYFTFTMSGQTGASMAPADSIGAIRKGDTTILFGVNPSASVRVMASFHGGDTTGAYRIDSMMIYRNNKYIVSTQNPVLANITSFGAPGQYIIGSYSGTLKDSSGTQTYPVTGVFKLKRKN
jgi:hypothetical protein